jgi:hypothetical protein
MGFLNDAVYSDIASGSPGSASLFGTKVPTRDIADMPAGGAGAAGSMIDRMRTAAQSSSPITLDGKEVYGKRIVGGDSKMSRAEQVGALNDRIYNDDAFAARIFREHYVEGKKETTSSKASKSSKPYKAARKKDKDSEKYKYIPPEE